MKGALAAMMCALKDVAAQDQVRVRFVCVPDEESEDVDAALDRRRSSRRGCTADFALTGEPTDLHIGVQAKGVLAVRLQISGTAAHGSTPWLGDNAILKAHDAFRRIETLPFSRESSDLFDRPSINLARIVGGDAFNKVPDVCTIDVDIRFLPNQDPGDDPDPDPRDRRTSRSSSPSRARRPSSRATTPTCWRCATRSGARSRATRCRSGATAPPTRSRSSRPASPRSSSAPSAAATTGRTSGSRSPRWRAIAGRWATSSNHLPAWLERQEQPSLRAVDGGLA